MMSIGSMGIVLSELGVRLTSEEIAVFFKTADKDGNGGLDLQEFTNAIKCPCKVKESTDTLPLSQLLAHCLKFKESKDPLKEISRLSSDELLAATNAYCRSLSDILAEALNELKKCYAEMDTKTGGMVVVPARASADLTPPTVKLQTQKRDTHLAAMRCMLAETARDLERIAREEGAQARLMRDRYRECDLHQHLADGGSAESILPGMSDGPRVTFTVEGLLARIGRQCEAVAERHAALPHEAFGHDSDGAYRALVREMLETRAAAVSTLRWYLEDPGLAIEAAMRGPLLAGHRGYLSFLERTLPAEGEARARGAGRLCRAMGLMQASADEADAEGLTPLMRAAADGAGGRGLRGLVAARADVDRRDAAGGRTALWLAAEGGHAEAVEALARLGADVDAAAHPGAEDCAPVWIAAKLGHAAVIEALGRLGADVNRAARGGRTPLFAAAAAGHSAAIGALGRLGADANRADADGDSPLFAAVDAGHVAVLAALARLGADVDRANAFGQTPLSFALDWRRAAVARELRRLGAAEEDAEGDADSE